MKTPENVPLLRWHKRLVGHLSTEEARATLVKIMPVLSPQKQRWAKAIIDGIDNPYSTAYMEVQNEEDEEDEEDEEEVG